MPERPSKLVTLCGFAIFFGAITFFLTIEQPTGNYIRQSLPDANQKVMKAYRQMMKDVITISKKWNVYLWVAFIGVLVSSLALLIGGICSLAMRPIGPKLLKIAIVFLIPLDTLRTGYQVFLTHKVMPSYISSVIDATSSSGADQNIQPIASGMGYFAIYSALTFTILFFLAKIIYGVISIQYFRKPETLALYNKQIPKPPPLRREQSSSSIT